MFAMASLALIIERLFGYPQLLQRLIAHPVQWMGSTLSWLERLLHDDSLGGQQQKMRGVLALALLLILWGGIAAWAAFLIRPLPYGWVAEALLAVPLLAQKSLREHVAAVAGGLNVSLQQGRAAVSHIVGRNPERLDEAGVSRAALESLAENTADGIVAPFFWFLILGLPGIVVYKAVNTADSMIGHRSERYLHFGWAAARLDDLLNLPASRLTGLLFAGAAALLPQADGRNALRAMWRDAGKHQSPNAGWPESALAGALGISLGGHRHYDNELVDLPTMGDGRSDLDRSDIARGLNLYGAALTLLLTLCLLGAVVF